MPDGVDHDFSFDVKLPDKNGTVILFYNADGRIIGGTWLLPDNLPRGYDNTQYWVLDNSMPAVPRNTPFKFNVHFNANERCYSYTMTDSSGKKFIGSRTFPFLKDGPVHDIRISPPLPQKNSSHYLSAAFSCGTAPGLSTRDKFSGISPDAGFADMLKRGTAYSVSGKTVDFELSRTCTGELLQLTAAEKSKLPETIAVRAYNSAGHWIELGKNIPVDPATGIAVFEKIENLVKLELTFPETDAAISGVWVWSPPGTPVTTLNKIFADKLEAEYTLAVYDRQYPGCDRAELTMINKSKEPIDLEISLHERLKDKPFGKTIKFTAKPGKNAYIFDLNHIPNGEYLTSIKEIRKDGHGGTMLRLLRHCTSPPTAAEPRTEVTGQKVFFPDNFFVKKSKNVDFVTGRAKAHLVHRGQPADDEFIVYGERLGFTADGKLAVNFFTQNRQWKGNTKYHAVADPDDLDNWKSAPGSVKIIDSPNPINGKYPDSAKPDWGPKLDGYGKISYRMYDPAKDGKVDLRQVKLVYISHDGGKRPGMIDYKWGTLTPARTSVWAVWYKSPGAAIILSRPVSGFPTLGSLEPPDSGSDLSFGQWVEDDGKTLCAAFGRHLMRFAPYAIKYDNISDRNRMVGIWRTRDGINWEQGFIGVPDLSKPESDQHYGGITFRVPDSAGLRIACLYRYSAKMQQISWEIVYTWDGFRWIRFQDQPQFLENGPFGSWNHGGGYLSNSAVEYKGKIYQMMHWVNDFYHFEAEIVHYHSPTVKHMDAEYVRKRYEPRHLKEWPLFQKNFNGSWEKLAQHLRNSTCSVGMIEYRKDGFFHASAGDETADLQTTAFTASGKLTANAVIHQGGFIEFTLEHPDGRPVSGFKAHLKSGDGIALPVFDKLPAGKFHVNIKFKNADIYTLNF